MKRRSFFSILATGVAVLVLISIVGFTWVFAQSPLGLLRGAPERNPMGAMFVPKHAPLMASLLVNPDRLIALRQTIARPAERRRARAELSNFQQSLLAESGLSYSEDIQPWLGDELTLAITTLDIDRDQNNGQQPGYLLALKTKDAERSREFLQLFWQKRAIAGMELAFEQYKGAQLIYSDLSQASGSGDSAEPEGQVANSLATAVVGNRFMLIANSPKVLRDAINTVQAAELGLPSAPVYQRAIASLTEARIGLAFINLPQFSALTGQAPKSAIAEALYESVAISLGLDRQGVLAETALLPAPGKPVPSSGAVPSQSVKALQYVSGVTPFVASGQDLAHLWTSLSQGLVGYEAIARLINQPLEAAQTRWNLQLTRDIFPWVKGEYALGLMPQIASVGDPNWVFVVDRRGSPDAVEAIAHLDDMAKQQGLTAVTLQLNNQPVSAWTQLSAAAKQDKQPTDIALQAQVAGVHASVGNYELFTNSVAAMDQVLQSSEQSLQANHEFAQAIAPLLKPNHGYLYVDWVNGKSFLENRFPLLQVAELVGQSFFNHLRSLSISSYGNEAGVQRGGVFIRLS